MQKSWRRCALVGSLLIGWGAIAAGEQGSGTRRAKDVQPAKDAKPVKDSSNAPTERTSRMNRGQSPWLIMANYSYFDLLLPAKTGLTGAYQVDARLTYELEYMKAALSIPFIVKDLGSFKEQRFAFNRRTYFETNSFSLFASATYNKMDLELGNQILTALAPDQVPYFDVLSVSTLGIGGGIGNRWTMDNGFTFGVDWISWLQPIYVTSADTPALDGIQNENDRKAVDAMLKTMTYFPRFVLLKFQIGWSF